jgi:SAM-dependent methyltransferase
VADFDELVTEATTAPFSGWDFSWLAGHSSTDPLAWDYPARVAALARTASTMLDMGTGGGELLSGLAARAPRTVATEAWPPNVPVAGRRLVPLGIAVVQNEGARDNMDQDGSDDHGRLPFRAASFDLVCNRHEAFRAEEVSRVLAPGGTFITQQVDYHSDDELVEMLGLDLPGEPDSWLALAEQQVATAGLVIEDTASGSERVRFDDIAGIAYYLRVVNWAIPGYSLATHRDRLRALFDSPGAWPFTTSWRRFMLVAVKPGRR